VKSFGERRSIPTILGDESLAAWLRKFYLINMFVTCLGEGGGSCASCYSCVIV